MCNKQINYYDNMCMLAIMFLFGLLFSFLNKIVQVTLISIAHISVVVFTCRKLDKLFIEMFPVQFCLDLHNIYHGERTL